MYYLIDGHNLIPQLPGLELDQLDDEQALVAQLQAFCRTGQHQVEVFFDNAPVGHTGQRRFGRVLAHFVRQGSTADAAIQARLQRAGRQARSWAVISSDRQVQAAARHLGAQVLSSQDFAQQLLAASSRRNATSAEEDPDLHLSAEELDEWLNLFDPGTQE